MIRAGLTVTGRRRCDWEWWKRLGGYFGGCGDLPVVGRFNAGQKTFFWIIFLTGGAITLTGALMILTLLPSLAGLWFTIHALLTGILALGTLAHLYIVYFLNPESVAKMLRGRQTERQKPGPE